MKKQTELQAHLKSLDACADAREWAGERTAQQVWDQCDRADWLLWWAARTSANSKQDIVRCAATIARTVAHLNGDPRVIQAIEAAEVYADKPTEENQQRAAEAARAAGAAWSVCAAGAAEEAAEAAVWAAWTAWTAGGVKPAAGWGDPSAWANWPAWTAEASARAARAAEEAGAAPGKNYCDIIRSILRIPWEDKV